MLVTCLQVLVTYQSRAGHVPVLVTYQSGVQRLSAFPGRGTSSLPAAPRPSPSTGLASGLVEVYPQLACPRVDAQSISDPLLPCSTDSEVWGKGRTDSEVREKGMRRAVEGVGWGPPPWPGEFRRNGAGGVWPQG